MTRRLTDGELLQTRAILAEHGGNQSAAARALGISRSTFQNRLLHSEAMAAAASAPMPERPYHIPPLPSRDEPLDALIARKREILAAYVRRLGHLQGLSLNPEPQGTVNGAWMPTVVFAPETGITREALQKAFAAANIDARVFFHPLSGLDIFEPRPANRHAWDIPGRAINLPSFHDMTEAEIDRVAAVVQELAGVR